ncbi:MAG TPA: N-acetyltransferase [Candidatus Baltobacteraceae bacterium]|nr:N-acetyltransferase [Candidatus Baltobacteraceae bacterium]
MQRDKEAIDALTAAFFAAFTARDRNAPKIDSLYDLFFPQAIIVQNLEGAGEVLDVPGFVEPRRAILTGGSMEAFREWEISETTDIFGHIAQRFSRYEKTWTSGGKACRGAGAKCLQFVRTAGGWKISALAWDDDVLILPLAAADLDRIRQIDALCFGPDDRYDDAVYDEMRASRESGVVVGYAFVQGKIWEADVHIRSFAVHPEHQRRGYGKALLRSVIENAHGSVDLLVDESNTNAVGLYESLGFVPAEMCPIEPPKRRMSLRGKE